MRYPSKYVLVTDLDDEQFSFKCAEPPVPVSAKHINDLGNQVRMHLPLGPAPLLSERVWQDCIANPVILCPSKEDNITDTDRSASATKPVWDFTDPMHKTTCICTK